MVDWDTDINTIVLKLKTIVTYATGVPILLGIVILVAWLVNICLYLKFAQKRLKRLRQNCTDEFTRKLIQNAQFNFYKFIIVGVVVIIEMCSLILPTINHGVFDRHFKSKEKLVCIEGCCLKNWTFAYNIEKLGEWKYISCFIDAGIYTAYFVEYWTFAILMQYSQLAFTEKESEKKRLVRSLKWKTAVFVTLSITVLSLLAIPRTILIGSSLYSVLTCVCLPIVIVYYRQLKRMRRRHLADLSYECYRDTSRIENEIHSVKWLERGSEVVVAIIGIAILLNTFQMVFIRLISTLLLNPCWLELNYSFSINIQLSNLTTNIFVLVDHMIYLLRSVIILFLFITIVVVHVAVVVDKLNVKYNRREAKQDLIKKLIEDNNAQWHAGGINVTFE